MKRESTADIWGAAFVVLALFIGAYAVITAWGCASPVATEPAPLQPQAVMELHNNPTQPCGDCNVLPWMACCPQPRGDAPKDEPRPWEMLR